MADNPSGTAQSPPPTSSADPVKETHREETAPKKPVLLGSAKRPAGTAVTTTNASASVTAGAKRPATGLQKPPARPVGAATGFGAVPSNRKPPSSSSLTAGSKSNSSTTTVPRRTSTVGATSGTPDRKASGGPTSPNSDRRASGVGSLARKTSAPPASSTLSSHRQRNSLTSPISNGRASVNSIRENAVSPRPPSVVGRPPSAASRPVVKKSPSSSSSVKHNLANAASNLRPRPSVASISITSASASLAGKEKELETLKAKVAELEEYNKALVEELVKAKEAIAVQSPETSSGAAAALEAATSKLYVAIDELEGMRARVANLEETIAALQVESDTAQKRNIELAAAVDSAAESVKISTDAIAVTHASEIQSLRHKFGVEENKLLEKISGFEEVIKDLKSEHAGEVMGLMKQVEEAVIAAQSKAATESGDLQQALDVQKAAHDKAIGALDAALATEKAETSKYSANSEFIVKKYNDEIATLKEALEVSDEAFVIAQAKANEALDAREREVDGLSNVVKHLTKEMENLTKDKQQELKEKIAELNSQHEAQIKDAHEKTKKIAQEANEKIETLTKLHQAQLEQGSGALAAQLQEVKAAGEAREIDLLEHIEIGKRVAAETVEVIKKENIVLQKGFEEKLEGFQREAAKTTEENHKELESKIGQLKSLYEEQINALMTESDKSQNKIEELLRDIEVTKREVNEGRATLEHREIEVEVLKETLDTLSTDLTEKEKQIGRLESELEKSVSTLAVKAAEIVELEGNHTAALESLKTTQETEISTLEGNIAGGDEMYTTLKADHDELVKKIRLAAEGHRTEIEIVIAENKIEVERLTEELKKAEEETFVQLRESHSAIIAHLESEIIAEKTAKAALQAALENASEKDEVEKLKTELAEERMENSAEHERLTKALGAQIAVKTTLQSEVEESKKNKQELLDQLALIQVDVDALRSSKEILQSNTDNLQKQLQEIGERTKADAGAFEKQLLEMNERANSETASLEQVYTLQIQELDAVVSSLRERLAAAETGTKSNDSTLRELEAAKKEKEFALAEAEKELDVLKQEAEAVINAAKKDLEALEQEKDSAFETAERKLEATKNNLEAALADMAKELASVRCVVGQKEAALEAIQNERESIESELKSFKIKFSSTEEFVKEKETALEEAIKEREEKEFALQKANRLANEKEAALKKLTKETTELEMTLKEKLALAEALIEEKVAALENTTKEAAAKRKVLEAELAEKELALKTKEEVSTGDELSVVGEEDGGENEEVKQITGLRAQLNELESENENLRNETNRVLKSIENLPLGKRQPPVQALEPIEA